MVRRADYWALRKIRMIADYQFFPGAGSLLFPNDVDVLLSPRTGKIKEIRENNIHIATLNPRSGFISLSVEGALRLMDSHDSPVVTIGDEYVAPVSSGGNVFAKHIVRVTEGIHPGGEAIIVSESSSLIAVGRSLLSSEEAKKFKHGVAIKVRRGVSTQDVPTKT